MKLIAIVAMSFPNGVIGKGGKLPWKLPEDMRRFRALTLGYPVIMGRKTHESIGGALPERMNIVLSRDPDYKPDGYVASNLKEAIEVIHEFGSPDMTKAFIIGGAEIYRQYLPECDELYLTVVNAPDVEGDAYFTASLANFKCVDVEWVFKDERNEYSMRFERWVRC